MKDTQPDLNRRSLLKAISVGSAAGVALAATNMAYANNSPVTPSKKNTDGYQDTAHIRSFYNSLRN